MNNEKLQANGLLTGQSFTALQAEKNSLKRSRLFGVSTSLLASLVLTSFPVAVSAEQATSKIDAIVIASARLDTAFGGDTDGDGISDGADNCTEVANAGQQDSD